MDHSKLPPSSDPRDYPQGSLARFLVAPRILVYGQGFGAKGSKGVSDAFLTDLIEVVAKHFPFAVTDDQLAKARDAMFAITCADFDTTKTYCGPWLENPPVESKG